MKWLVVTISNRHQRLGHVIAGNFQSLTDPMTDFVVLDGTDGISQTYNRGVPPLLRAWSPDYLVTIDDDIVLPHGWQRTIERAMELLEPGMLSLDLDVTGTTWIPPPHARYDQSELRDGIVCTPVPQDNIGGSMLVQLGRHACAIGEIPFYPGIKYSPCGDGWRCMQARTFGGLWYVEGPEGKAKLLDRSLTETAAERESKDRDTAIYRARGMP